MPTAKGATPYLGTMGRTLLLTQPRRDLLRPKDPRLERRQRRESHAELAHSYLGAGLRPRSLPVLSLRGQNSGRSSSSGAAASTGGVPRQSGNQP